MRDWARRLIRQSQTLSMRLTFWHSLIVLVSGLVLLALTYALLSNRMHATERESIKFRLNLYKKEYDRGGVEGVRRLADLRKTRSRQAYFVRVADNRNVTVFQRDMDEWADFLPERLSGQPLPPADELTWQTLTSRSGTHLYIVSELQPDGSVIQVGKSIEDLTQLLGEFRRCALLVLAIFVPIGFIGGAFLASRGLRPVRHLTEVAEKIVETGDFDMRVPGGGNRDELDAMVHVFNEMLTRIDALVRGMRESIDNVAHDLRTPLTRLRARAQDVLTVEASLPRGKEKCPRCDPAMEALADCVEEAERVSSTLDTLMEIAEAEAGLAKLAPKSVSLASALEGVVSAFAEPIEERELIFTMAIPQDLRVFVDEIALSRVFANLLDNSIKYTPRGGRLDIAARQKNEFVEVTVADTGMGIAPEDLPRIWERLFRSDRSRAERGLGLGLSFVRAIVEAHEGKVSATSELGKGTAIVLILPAI